MLCLLRGGKAKSVNDVEKTVKNNMNNEGGDYWYFANSKGAYKAPRRAQKEMRNQWIPQPRYQCENWPETVAQSPIKNPEW